MIAASSGDSCAVEPFVDGEFCRSYSEARHEVINPSTGERYFWIPRGCDADVERAVRAARRAFEEARWVDMPPSSRKQVLYRFAELIKDESNALDALDAGEMGKPVSETFCNASAGAQLMHFNAECVDKIGGDVFGSDKRSLVLQRRVPRGVVAAIVPWNFPTYNAILKIAPALAAGNSVVLKPSELSSRSAMRLAELSVKAGLPRGVLNVVPGVGESVGRALGLHPSVDMLAFTGSSKVGGVMMQYAGQSNLKVVVAECGGKSPHIVLDDGLDLDAVADFIARSLLTNQGQICSVGSRLLVQRSIEARLVERLVARMQKIVIGSAVDSRTTFGPLASAKQFDRVMQYIEVARDEGAQLATGGHRTLPDSGGYFVEPTVFRNVAPASQIAREEIFGPVLSVIAFDTEAEAVRLANETIYGLLAYVWTTDLSAGMRLTKGIRASVLLNAAPPTGEGVGHAASIEPAGQSGVGVEGGVAGVESYLRRQLVWINHA